MQRFKNIFYEKFLISFYTIKQKTAVSYNEKVPRNLNISFRRPQYVNAIELDLSISKDNVIFLWHDPDPWDIISTLRR